MKHILSSFCILFFFLVIILFPSNTLYGASNGLLLWFQILIPTLLPFLIVTNLLIQTNAITYIVIFMGPIIQRLFSVSAYGSFAVLAGFLCGYPVGAKVTNDLLKRKQISLAEGNYLLSFCNQTSPAFLVSYVIIQKVQDTSLILPSLIILYLSAYICSLIFRTKFKKETLLHSASLNTTVNFHFQLLDDSIMNAFETITKIGGYIILFSVLFTFGQRTPLSFFLPLLEISNGTSYIISRFTSFPLQYAYLMGLCSLGGLCSIAQTYSVIQGSGLSIHNYIIKKLITALVTSLLSFLYVVIILR